MKKSHLIAINMFINRYNILVITNIKNMENLV